MAKFKLYLITAKALSTNTNGSYKTEFLKQPISEFSSQLTEVIERKDVFNLSYNDTFCYTYNEKFSIHAHSQKELTFSLDRYFIREDRIEYNPFAPYMTSGSQLLLVDKYDNHHLMTITKVKYDFKENNVVYDVTCQDSFTYQTIRQNDGYSIENDSSSEDFIGSQNVDWWADKITTECRVGYVYLKLEEELYLNEDNILTSSKEKQIKQIKKAYSLNDYDAIPFKQSGNASSVLIALAEELGLSIKTFEYFDDETCQLVRYFWFEPSKKNEVSGLSYSPYSDIESFSLTHNGASLTTILNVQSHAIGDELISILPSVPLFFKNYFKSTNWKESKYKNGLFGSLIRGETFTFNSDDFININMSSFATETNQSLEYRWNNRRAVLKSQLLYIPIYTDIKNLYYKENHFYPIEKLINTSIVCSDSSGNEFILTQDTYEYSFEHNNNYHFIVLDVGENFNKNIVSYTISYNRSRKYTEEELKFVEIAEQCPWLENKIIDFNYFIDHGVLTKFEYAELVKLIYDELRIVNGELLVWAEAYYKALSEQVETVANITNSLDMIGATFDANIITPYRHQNMEIITDDFDEAYNSIFTIAQQTTKTPLLNFDSVYSNYIQKYVDTEQNFLENMYNFQNYFDAQLSWGDNLIHWTADLSTPSETYSCNKGVYKLIKQNNQGYDYAYLSSGEKVNVANPRTHTNYYVKTNESVTYKRATSYSPNETYYAYIYDEDNEKWIYSSISHDNMKKTYIKSKRNDFKIESQIKKPSKIEPSTMDLESFFNNNNNYYYDESLDYKTLWKINHPLANIILKDGDEETPTELVNFNNYKNYKTIWNDVNTNTNQTPLESYISMEPSYKVKHPAKYSYDTGNESFNALDNSFATDYYYGSDICYYNNNNNEMNTISTLFNKDYFTNKTIQLLGRYPDEQSVFKEYEYYFLPADSFTITSDLRTVLTNNSDDFYKWYILESKWFKAFSEKQWGDRKERNLNQMYQNIGLIVTGDNSDKYKYEGKYFYLFEVRNNKTFIDVDANGSNIDLNKIVDAKTLNYIDWQDTDLYKGYYIIDNTTEDDFKLSTGEYNDTNQYYEKMSDGSFRPIPNSADLENKYYTIQYEDLHFDNILTNNATNHTNPESSCKIEVFNKNTKEREEVELNIRAEESIIEVADISSIGDIKDDKFFPNWSRYKIVRVDFEIEEDIFTTSYLENNCFLCPLSFISAICYSGSYIKNSEEEKYYIETKDLSNNPLSTNGQFWYQHKNNLNNNLLLQKAAEIEMTLTDYWQRAYTSSKYCNYFIPEFWQATEGREDNIFFDQLFQINGSTIDIKYDLIPKVLVSNTDSNYTRYIKFLYQSLGKKDQIVTPLIDLMNNNPAIKQIFQNELHFSEEQIDKWSCQIINDNTDLTRKTYFIAEKDTGLTWQQALYRYVPNHCIFNNFGGLYQMMINFFNQEYYINNPMTEYERLKNQQQSIWLKIYQSFPNVILEKKYINESATSSIELLKLAKNAMKDYSTLEREYNISLIDASNIRGYIGQELTIGLPIKVSSEEYYDGYDDIKTSLNQYLFISDLSYNLRSDSNVSVTVNSIKYEDKLIRQLAKLIR